MSHEEATEPELRDLLNGLAMVLTVIAATLLRARRLGGSNFWYDEVVTMRLAETPTIGELLKLLFQIDATRAPLHPLILQDWLVVFGNSETAGRSLSVVFGVATVVLLYFLGRLAFDEATGRWGAFLSAFSPLMVYYSREARMYALLVLISSLSWVMLFWNRRSPSRWKTIGYAACLVVMLFTHPLGLLMLGTLGLASALDVRGFLGAWKPWFAVHLGVLIVAAPWLRFYFDHAPEFLSGRLPIKFLLATPIGFLGGDSVVYGMIVALIVFGLYRRRIMEWSTREWIPPACLVLWLVLPPTVLYAYSWVASPIFGPARYTLFCAPAYILLVAQALARIPPLSRWTLGLGLACLALASMRTMVYDPPNKRMQWREAFSDRAPGTPTTVMYVSDVEPDFEIETARYYLKDKLHMEAFDENRLALLQKRPNHQTFLLVGGGPRSEISPRLEERLRPFVKDVQWRPAGTLRVYRLEAAAPPRPAPEPAAPARPAPD